VAEEFEANGAVSPAWWDEMWSNYRAGVTSVFILHGNVGDFVEHRTQDRALRSYVESRLSLMHTVASFAPDQGITFPGNDLTAREGRQWFDQVLGVAPPAADANDLTALLAAESGNATFGGQQGEDLTKLGPTQAIPLMIDFVRKASMKDPACPLGVAGAEENRRTFPKRSAVIIERLDLICPPSDKSTLSGGASALLALLGRIGTDKEINQQRNLVILLAPSLEEIHPDLRVSNSNIHTVEIEVPDFESRLRYIQRILPARRAELDDLDERELATETAGLNRRHIEDIAIRAAAQDGRLTRAMVRVRKGELIKSEYGGILEVVEPTVSLDDVGGHDAVKAWLQDWILTPIESGDPELLEAMPQGILLSGPSGTGKTLLARALARAMKWPFIFLRPENVKSSWVGESEKLWAKAMRGAKAMAPAVIFFDEIDQKVRRGGANASGGGDAVENNMFGRLLEWMTEPSSQGQLLFVGACNEPQNVDPALKRPGRFGDGKLPLLAPETPEERGRVVQAALNARGLFAGAPDEPLSAPLLALGETTVGWTQAELGSLAKKAHLLAKIRKVTIDQALSLAVKRMRPATADLRRMSLLALAECDDLSLVPPKWLPLLDRLQRAEDAQATAPRSAAATSPVSESRVGDVDDFDLPDLDLE
jgi:transitional endoplasmic reticulum ATPase